MLLIKIDLPPRNRKPHLILIPGIAYPIIPVNPTESIPSAQLTRFTWEYGSVLARIALAQSTVIIVCTPGTRYEIHRGSGLTAAAVCELPHIGRPPVVSPWPCVNHSNLSSNPPLNPTQDWAQRHALSKSSEKILQHRPNGCESRAKENIERAAHLL